MQKQFAPQVLYESKEFAVINKPAGMLTHRTAQKTGGDKWTLADWVRATYPETATVGDDPALRPGMVHRLDRETSGAILIARTQTAFDYLKLLFVHREIVKIYTAIVRGAPKTQGSVTTPIGMVHSSVKRSVHARKLRKEARTEFKVVRRLNCSGTEYAVLEVIPRTGRTHQIRVHLSSIGSPIAGDRLYGEKRPERPAPRLLLHARSLEFTAPSGTRLKIEAAEPPEFATFLAGCELSTE